MEQRPVRRVAIVAISALLLFAACGGGGASTAPSAAPAATAAPTEAPSATPVAMTILVDDTQNTIDTVKGLTDAYTALHPEVTFTQETRPGGADGDNIVKTRLATGDMPDLFFYNSGSLLQALNPAETLVDLSGESFIANITPSFLPTVSQGTGVYGVPAQTAMGGGILYNKKVFADNGLTVPTTWAEFAANNDKLKAAGIAPIGATYKDTWTSQLFVLADYYNVQSQIPDFADQFTNNKIKYATTPAALAGFQHLQEAFDKGWYEKDFGSATFDDGLNMLAAGEIAQYPMLTFALGTIAANHPDNINDIGFFGQPGDDAAKNGATIWMPAGLYLPKTTKNIDAAKAFLGFVASVEGTEAITKAVAPSGPYVINGSKLPADALPAVLDIQGYLDKNAAGPALEFLSPVKGPSLEQITVAVGSGLTSAEEGAKQYDADVEKQAKQLGLPGW
jgi:raffinose/stachyose/melibiose transport system substrate-binding protein